MGLIGYAEEEVITKEESVDHNYKQTFLPIARYLKKDKDLPTAPSHFFIHPSLYHKICKHVDSSVFYNKNNVVGYDRPFFPPNNGKPMHVHFGLSHRSLCLLIPSLNQRNNLAIIQSPDNEFFLDEQLSKQKTLKLIINENIEINCVILNENFRDYDLEIAEIIAKWKSGSNVLIYSSDLKTINNFIQLADTISTSKNNGGWSTKENNEFGKLLNLIPKDKNINLFAFEKNQTSHQNIVKYLNTHKPKVSVFRSMVDVYYYGKESQIGDSKNIEISIAGEIEQDNYAPFYFVADLDTISKTFSNNDGRFNFRNNLSDERMDYYVARYYLLTDAIYFLCKCYLNTGKNYSEDAIKSHFKKILDIYIQTTVEYLMTKYQKTIADTYNESKQNLIKFGQNSFQRFLKLPEDRQNHNIGQRSLQQLWKKLKKYNDFNFHESLYEYLDQGAKNTEMSDFFKSFNEFSKLVELRKNVNTDENKTKWKSVFLCYSRIEKDRIFVDNIYNGLKTLGIDVFKYNYDADPGQINFDMINEEIESRDNFLFIATENSILRNWCHIEIEMWRNKHKCDKNDDTPHFIHIPNAFKTVENYSVNFIPGKLLEAIPAMGENQISRTWKKVITQTNTTIDLPLLREQIKQKCIRNIEELKNRGITDTFCQNISSSDLQTFMITLKDFADRNFKKDS